VLRVPDQLTVVFVPSSVKVKTKAAETGCTHDAARAIKRVKRKWEPRTIEVLSEKARRRFAKVGRVVFFMVAGRADF
jgi:hypothetical protein